MPGRLGYLLFFASRFFLNSEAAECNPIAVSLPFKSVVLGNRAETRGVQFQIGKPNAQTLALLPSASYNDTYTYPASGLCAKNTPNEKCTTYRGGLYDSTLSESEKAATQMGHVSDDANATWTFDDVVLKDGQDKDIELPQLEFGVRVGTSHPYVNKGEIGLGVNSSFLDALASGQRIASKTYSFFWGTDAAISDEPREGSLTLGGYDQALIGDALNTTMTFNRDQWRCREGMVVDLTEISLQSLGAGTQNILEGSEKLQACVVPTLTSVLTLPEQYWDKMVEIMGVEPSPVNNGTTDELFYGIAQIQPKSATSFTGDLKITVNDAVTVTIPNKQLIFDEPFIAPRGRIERNTTYKNIPVVRYTDSTNNMPRLGGMFFSSAYLMVNHDKNEFSISQVQDNPVAQKLVGVDTANGCVAAADGGATTVPEAPRTSDNPEGSGGLSGGAIAGIVVGVVAAILIIAGIAFLVWRRRRVAAAPYNAELERVHEGVPIAEKHGYNTSEMYAGNSIGEISGHSRDYAVELDGSSRPSEVPGHGVERESLMGYRR